MEAYFHSMLSPLTVHRLYPAGEPSVHMSEPVSLPVILGADLDKLNVYYAYVSDETMENAAINALYGAEVVSVDN